MIYLTINSPWSSVLSVTTKQDLFAYRIDLRIFVIEAEFEAQ